MEPALAVVPYHSSGGVVPPDEPRPHGLPRIQLETIRSLLRDLVESGEAPGVSLLLAHHGEVIFREAFGWADVEAERPLTADDLVWIGSGTKPVAATCVVRLAEQGRLDLDAPIQQYLPEFRGVMLRGGLSPSSLPTTRQLLCHTSGIIATAAWSVFWKTDGAFDPNSPPPPRAVFDQRVLAGSLTHSLAEAVRRTARYHLAGEPGRAFAYSGAAFNVASRVAEVAAGAPFDTLLELEVLAPVGMTRTTFKPPAAEFARMPVRYTRGSTGLRPLPPTVPTSGEPRFVMASGGLASTLDDCARFLQAHLAGGRIGTTEVLSEAAAREMTTDHTEGLEGNTKGRGYGLGWSIDRVSPQGRPLTISHGGALGTTLWIDLDRELTGVLFAQMQPPSSALREVTRSIQARIRERIAPHLPSS